MRDNDAWVPKSPTLMLRPVCRLREDGFQCTDGHQLLSSVERYGAVADTGAVSDSKEHLPSGFRTDRIYHSDQSGYRVSVATGRRVTITDRNPKPYSLAFGMTCTFAGILLLAVAMTYPMLLVAVAMVGLGSAVFHPESSRVARLASGGRYGLAQSVFQVGGNAGSSIGPLAAAFVVLPGGQRSVAWFSSAALLGIVLLTKIGGWYKRRAAARVKRTSGDVNKAALSSRKIAGAVAVLLALIFSKYFYLASLSSYYTFYLISKFGVSVQKAQVLLFVFLAAVAAGTIIGGPVGDKIGRKYVIWCSILRRAPLHSRAPLCESVLDCSADCVYWHDPCFCVLGHSRVRPGVDARKRGNDLRAVLRVCIRDGRIRRGRARASRGCHKH